MDSILLNSSETFAEGITILSCPLDTDMGIKTPNPFILSVSAESANYMDLRVRLYAANSKSIPYTSELDNNWSSLKPQWRFIDSDGNYIEESMPIEYTHEVLDENGNVRGGVGRVEFYYVDDLPCDHGSPVFIYAIVDTSNYYDKGYASNGISLNSHYNNGMYTVFPFYVYPIKPAFIHFSKNGDLDVHDKQWAGTNINAYATIHGIPRSQFLNPDICAVDYPILFNLPASGSDGSTNILKYTIYPLTGSEIIPSGVISAEFDVYDTSNAAYTGGWAEVNIASSVEVDSAILSGYVSLIYNPDDYYTSTTAKLWISNQKSNTLHRLDSIIINPYDASTSGMYASIIDKMSKNVFNTGFTVSGYDSADFGDSENSNVYEISGQMGIYGMAVDGNENLWHVDFELDRIYKRNSSGELLVNVDLRTVPELSGNYAYDEYTWYGPNAVATDSNNYAYVTLFNSPSGIVVNPSGDVVALFSNPPFPSDPLSGNESSSGVRVIDIEVGNDNAIYVLYFGNDTIILNKYDPYNGVNNYLSLNYSQSYISQNYRGVMDMVYSGHEQIFFGASDGIYMINLSNPSSIYKYLNCSNVSYLTLDINWDLWFIYEENKIGHVLGDGVAEEHKEDPIFYYEIQGTDLTNDVVGGLSCDITGYLNIIDKYRNIVYRINFYDFVENGGAVVPFGVKITPEDNYVLINFGDGGIQRIDATSGQPVDSLYAFGDWTGLAWNMKFSSSVPSNPNVETTICGSSLPFAVKSFENNYELRRINDSWDMKAQIKSYVIPDYQKNFTNLWDDLIGNIVGDASSEYQRFGRQFYEKISNFVLNHSDIDLCNIKQAYSQFIMLDKNYPNYNFNYPADLQHWMNIMSIDYKRLKGDQYQCNRNFKYAKYADIQECDVCGQIHNTNLGGLISDPIMVEGVPVVIKDTYMSENAFDIFYPPISGSFEQLSEYGFRSPFESNYEVYEYIPTVSSNAQAQGFIKWDDQYNETQISATNAADWWKDSGNVEDIFSQILYNKLGVAIDYTTDVQASESLSISYIGDLSAGESALVSVGVVSGSEFFIPFKNRLCSPILGYALQFYSAAPEITASGWIIPSGIEEIPSGVEISGSFVEIVYDDISYYAQVYGVDEILSPVVGDGLHFINGVSIPEFGLEFAGYLVFEKDSNKILLPVNMVAEPEAPSGEGEGGIPPTETPSPFITVWETTEPNQTIGYKGPIGASGFSGTISVYNHTTNELLSTNTYTGPEDDVLWPVMVNPGTYRIEIIGSFPFIQAGINPDGGGGGGWA